MAKDEDNNDNLIKLGKEHFKQKITESTEVDAIDETLGTVFNIEDADKNLKLINELNAKHIFVNTIAGNSYVTYKVYNEVTEREEVEFLRTETFKNIYSNRPVEDDSKRIISAGMFWLQESRRRTVDSIIFDPSEDKEIVERAGRKYLNMWEGFSTKPKYKKGGWRKTQKHVYKILCNSDHVKFKYVMKWLAWCIQNPDKRAEVALVFKGEKGAGKSFLFIQLKKLFGRHGMVISDPNRLGGQHSGHLQDLSFLFCDEVYYPGNKEIEGRIKAIITEEFLDVRKLFRDPITVKNRLHIVMCTNNEWVIPATKDERRYFIENINNMYAKGRASKTQREIYFNKIWGEMENGGREAMLYDLKNYNLNDWHPRNDVPETDELKKQKEISLNALLSTIKQMLEDGILPGEYKNGFYYVSSKGLKHHLEDIEPMCAKFSTVRKADAIRDLGAKKERTPGTGNIRWIVPPLTEMRRKWDKIHGPVAWDNCDKWSLIRSEF